MSPHLPGTKPESLEILGKILSPAQIRRFERMDRISQCVEVASNLNARHLYMEDSELGGQLAELLKLLIREKAEAQMEHFHALEDAGALNAGRPFGFAEAPKLMPRLRDRITSLIKRGR